MKAIGDAVLLGAIQGIAEWLPVSSSGHLLLARTYLGLEGSFGLDVFLHSASLCVILVFFRKELLRVVTSLALARRGTEEFRLGIFVLFATIVTAVCGLFLKRYGAALLNNPTVLGFSFSLTTVLLFLSRREGSAGLSAPAALIIGLVQAVALLPGVSRSGSTISVAKLLRVRSDLCFTFSFLIALPAILGALILEWNEICGIPLPALAAGFLTCACLGFISLTLLRRVVRSNSLHLFGWYTLAVAAGCFILSAVR